MTTTSLGYRAEDTEKDEIVRLAQLIGLREGKRVTTSDLLREAMEEYMQKRREQFPELQIASPTQGTLPGLGV